VLAHHTDHDLGHPRHHGRAHREGPQDGPPHRGILHPAHGPHHDALRRGHVRPRRPHLPAFERVRAQDGRAHDGRAHHDLSRHRGHLQQHGAALQCDHAGARRRHDARHQHDHRRHRQGRRQLHPRRHPRAQHRGRFDRHGHLLPHHHGARRPGHAQKRHDEAAHFVQYRSAVFGLRAHGRRRVSRVPAWHEAPLLRADRLPAERAGGCRAVFHSHRRVPVCDLRGLHAPAKRRKNCKNPENPRKKLKKALAKEDKL